ncbi:hypothetical protein HDZ31DRAFT_69649 [Schizophyllum fasciatum]
MAEDLMQSPTKESGKAPAEQQAKSPASSPTSSGLSTPTHDFNNSSATSHGRMSVWPVLLVVVECGALYAIANIAMLTVFSVATVPGQPLVVCPLASQQAQSRMSLAVEAEGGTTFPRP